MEPDSVDAATSLTIEGWIAHNQRIKTTTWVPAAMSVRRRANPRRVPAGRAATARRAEPRIAELEAELRALRRETARCSLVLSSALDYAVITMDEAGRITGWNPGAERIFGYAEAEILGRSGEIVFTDQDRADAVFSRELRRAIETGTATNERWHLRRDGTKFWASGTMMPMRLPDGRCEGFLNILRDRTEARAEAERRELLTAEMSHRVKNAFSLVQAVAAQSARHAASGAEFQAAFDARLAALARSHDLLIRGGWADAPLRDIVEGALAAYGGEPGRFRVEGAPVLLPAHLVATVSLAFHELATNAVKYGALSARDGRVEVEWSVCPGPAAARRVEIGWRERGGPPVSPPERRGFGFQVLTRGTAGGVELAFPTEGLECRMSLSLGAGS